METTASLGMTHAVLLSQRQRCRKHEKELTCSNSCDC
jgi:hypothetical protein